ncbi:MAG: phage tail tape measure protein [Oscillospiraceae bacterium]|nr:phage tail tape measure protein [Oscillospiraceae bacterium]
MADRIKGITVEIGGDTKGLSKALGGVNKDIRDTQSQLKDVERLLKFDPTNTELLAQRQRLLATAVDDTKTKLTALKDAEVQVQKQMKEGKASQEQYEALQREIIATEQSLKKLEDQAEKSNATIAKIDATAEKVASAAGNISKATAPLTAGIVGLGAIAFNEASEIQDAMGATEQVFGSQAQKMQQWADNLETYYGIAEGEALTYANTMGSMLKNIGNLTEEEAARQSQTLIKLAGDLTAMYGGSTADAVYALTGALKGNNTMLDNYGMAVNESLIKTKALEKGLIREGEEMTLAAKQAATLELTMEQAADAMGQAEREADGASGSMRAAKTEIKNLSTEIGENLIPIITPLIQKVSEAVSWFGSMDESQQMLLITILAVVAAISPVAGIISAIATIVPVVTSAFVALNGVMAANPVFFIITGIMLLITAFSALWEKSEAFRNFWLEIWGNITKAFDNTVIWIGNGVNTIAMFFANLWDGIINGAKSCLNRLIDGINRMIKAAIAPLNALIEAANLIPGVHIQKLKFEIPKIPMLADGGIVLRGSAIVGEAGPELLTVSPHGTVVTPLTSGGGAKTAGGIGSVQFIIQGYTANEAQHIADIVNRKLGEVYG